jgi:hypothetical protein
MWLSARTMRAYMVESDGELVVVSGGKNPLGLRAYTAKRNVKGSRA